MTKSVFIHLLKPREAERESLVYISNFLVMAGLNLEWRIQKLRPERNRADDITGHASKNGQEPSENNKLQ